MYQKRDARAKMLFCYYKPIAFLPFLLPSPSSLLTELPKEKLTTQVIVMSFRQRGVKSTPEERNVTCLVTLISDGRERQLDCLSFNQHVMVRCLYCFR